MVTATTGTMTFVGRQSGRRYGVSCYVSDVIGAAVTFNVNGAAAAGSPSTFQLPEPVTLVDAAVITGPTVMTGFKLQSGGMDIPGSSFLLGSVLTTIQTRIVPNISFGAKSIIGAVQF